MHALTRRPLVTTLLATLLGLLVLLPAGALPARGAAPALAAQSEGDEIAVFVQDTLTAANIFWEAEFRRLGVAYMRPRVVLARDGVGTPGACDEDAPSVEHSYCESDTTITLDIDSDDEEAFADPNNADRPLVIVYVVAHEVGHHVQYLLNLDGLADFPANVRYELQADCLAGVFVRTYARAAAWVERGDLLDAIDKARESGDPLDIPEREREHGAADQRARAFTRGFDGSSPAACGAPAR